MTWMAAGAPDFTHVDEDEDYRLPGGLMLLERDWRDEAIGLGVARCPYDPENFWPLP